MSTHKEIEEIERRVKELDLLMSFVLRRAKVPAATWTRWKQGTQNPSEEKWGSVVAAVNDLERRLT